MRRMTSSKTTATSIPSTPTRRFSLRARTALRAGLATKEPTKLEIPNLKVT